MPWETNFDREETLNRAMCAFWERGFEATSMADLVTAMRINRASIYNTYGDKRALFLAALKHYDRTVREHHLARLESTETPCLAIRGLFDTWLLQAKADRKHNGCFLTNTAIELAAHDEAVHAIVKRGQNGIEEFFARHVTRAQAIGEADPQLDARKTAQSLLATLTGMLVLARSRPQPTLLKSIAAGAMTLIAPPPAATTIGQSI